MIAIDNESLTKLRNMKLSAMAEALENISELPGVSYSTSEVIQMMIDHEYDKRQNSRIRRIKQRASLAQPYADLRDLQITSGRNIDFDLINRLASGSYLAKHQDVVLQGPTGSGKTFVGCALANKACLTFHSVLYISASDLLDRISIAEQLGEKSKVISSFVKYELLVLDDWFLKTPTNRQVEILHSLIDRRYRSSSTIYCSQLRPSDWHEMMQEKVLADAILDRIVNNAHMTELTCDKSMRTVFNCIEE